MRMPQINIRGIRIIADRFKPTKRIRIKGLIKGLNPCKVISIRINDLINT